MSVSSNGPQPAIADFILLNEEIAALVRARMPLEAHLRDIAADLPGKAGTLGSQIADRLSAGESLPDAIEAECADMPSVYRAVILSGVESGHPATAIEALVDTATRMDQLRRITGIALLYPLIVVIISSLLFAVVITQIVPQFEWLSERHFGLFRPLSHHPLPVILVSVAISVFAVLSTWLWWRRSAKQVDFSDQGLRLLGAITGLNRVHRWSNAATFAELTMLLVESGLPLERALRLVADSVTDRGMRNEAIRLAGRIEQGEPAMSRNSLSAGEGKDSLPPLIGLALFHSTNRPLFTACLRQAAALYRERANQAAEWYCEYVPTLATLVIGGSLTLCYALTVLWPYASTLRELANWNWR